MRTGKADMVGESLVFMVMETCPLQFVTKNAAIACGVFYLL